MDKKIFGRFSSKTLIIGITAVFVVIIIVALCALAYIFQMGTSDDWFSPKIAVGVHRLNSSAITVVNYGGSDAGFLDRIEVKANGTTVNPLENIDPRTIGSRGTYLVPNNTTVAVYGYFNKDAHKYCDPDYPYCLQEVEV